MVNIIIGKCYCISASSPSSSSTARTGGSIVVYNTASSSATATSSASGSGTNLAIVLKNVFQSLINAVINSINPNLNPNEQGPIYTTIDSTINLVVNFFDSNNNQVIVPIVFSMNTSSLLSIGNISIITPNNLEDLTATSASLKGTLGQLLLLLDQQIPTISRNLNACQGVTGPYYNID
jgi:hypothetical protein